jgi:hypothetical protein
MVIQDEYNFLVCLYLHDHVMYSTSSYIARNFDKFSLHASWLVYAWGEYLS